MRKFSILTLGCKVNRYESDAIAEKLERDGWRRAAEDEPPELCIVNTCTVTGKAAMQSRQAIRRLEREHPGTRILVTGCYAETAPGEIRTATGIREIVGHSDKHRIPEFLREPGPVGSTLGRVGDDLSRKREFAPMDVAIRGNRTRPVLKIQDGCDAFCTYCIVPYARGRSRSMPVEKVLENIRRLEAAGYHEVVLSGIHLGRYGPDLSPGTDLDRLLGRIEAETAIGRVRLSSIEPGELTPGIIDRVARSDRLCPHFHVPLQSGDDTILKRMGRPYSGTRFKDLITRIHDRIPEAAIGVDVLVGFPGETGEAFDRTRRLIDTLPVTYLHVFPFSPRAGTPASRYPDPVPNRDVSERCRNVRNFGFIKKSIFYDKFINNIVEVLVEEKHDPGTNLLKGVTPNYLSVRLPGAESLKNTRVRCRVEERMADGPLLAIPLQ
jgi:threonylcarbamoyladenosine tRNA methylthiotransferase MtaB